MIVLFLLIFIGVIKNSNTMKRLVFVLFVFTSVWTGAQEIKFESVIDLDASEVKSQDRTGTCWSFSTTSFIESELMRMGKGNIDLSEMYNVRMVYPEKAINYIRYHGKTQFGEGALAHDVINTIDKYGLVPESAYHGKMDKKERYDHSELVKMLESTLQVVLGSKTVSNTWMTAYNSILDGYLGAVPETFEYDGKTYTPKDFANSLGIKSSDYVSITSFSHHDFYESFILEVPDNFSNGTFHNVTLDELVQVVDHALKNGYTVAWDADVSEKTFSSKNGMAIWPETSYANMSAEDRNKLFKSIVPEMKVTQEIRQAAFEDHTTTDDHLMHITGTLKDSDGNIYYKVKNSWGTKAGIDGFIYVSQAYFRMKTISLLLHNDGLIKSVKSKLSL